MADMITIRTDEETEHALDVLTREGIARPAAIGRPCSTRPTSANAQPGCAGKCFGWISASRTG
jgi:hypothetical protein